MASAGVAICLIAASAAAGGGIQLVVTTTIVPSPADVRIAIEMRNRGDEPAHEVTPVVTFRGEDRAGGDTAVLNPSESQIESMIIPVAAGDGSADIRGSWPLVVRVAYTDSNNHPFETLHVTTVRFGNAEPRILTVELTGAHVEKSGPISARLESRVPTDVSLSFVSAAGLSIAPADTVVRVPAQQAKDVTATVVAGEVAVGRLPVFAIAEYNGADGHETVVAPAIVEIEPKKADTSSKTRAFALIAAIILATAAIAFVSSRRRGRAT